MPCAIILFYRQEMPEQDFRRVMRVFVEVNDYVGGISLVFNGKPLFCHLVLDWLNILTISYLFDIGIIMLMIIDRKRV